MSPKRDFFKSLGEDIRALRGDLPTIKKLEIRPWIFNVMMVIRILSRIDVLIMPLMFIFFFIMLITLDTSLVPEVYAVQAIAGGGMIISLLIGVSAFLISRNMVVRPSEAVSLLKKYYTLGEGEKFKLSVSMPGHHLCFTVEIDRKEDYGSYLYVHVGLCPIVWWDVGMEIVFKNGRLI